MSGCIWEIVIFLIASVFFAFIDRISDKLGGKWSQVIPYGIAIIAVIGVLWGIIVAYRKRKTMLKTSQAAKNSWKATSKTALLTIVDCQEAPGGREKRANRYRYAPDYVELAMSPDQQAASPDQTTIRAAVSRAVLKRLRERSTVRIYYQPDSPLTFLLDEEL